MTGERWEYHVMYIHGDERAFGNALNGVGRKGWELVAVTHSGAAMAPIAYLKRRLEEKKTDDE